MAANEKLTIQALKDHDKVLPKLKAHVGQPLNREVCFDSIGTPFFIAFEPGHSISYNIAYAPSED